MNLECFAHQGVREGAPVVLQAHGGLSGQVTVTESSSEPGTHEVVGLARYPATHHEPLGVVIFGLTRGLLSTLNDAPDIRAGHFLRAETDGTLGAIRGQAGGTAVAILLVDIDAAGFVAGLFPVLALPPSRIQFATAG